MGILQKNYSDRIGTDQKVKSLVLRPDIDVSIQEKINYRICKYYSDTNLSHEVLQKYYLNHQKLEKSLKYQPNKINFKNKISLIHNLTYFFIVPCNRTLGQNILNSDNTSTKLFYRSLFYTNELLFSKSTQRQMITMIVIYDIKGDQNYNYEYVVLY